MLFNENASREKNQPRQHVVSQQWASPAAASFERQQQQQRFFSSRQQNNNRRQKKGGPPINEVLVSFLVKSKACDASDIPVRLVAHREGDDKAPVTEVVSLLEAVNVSVELGVDLIGINMTQDPPILKAQDFDKLMYKTERSKSKSNSKNNSSQKAVKEFKFKANIADHDFDRKVDNTLKYLKKGHSCVLTLTSNFPARRKNPNVVVDMVERLTVRLGGAAITGKVKLHPEKINASVVVQPNNKK